MATRTAKLRVELDGEKKYKEAIAEINRESKTLGAEMKKLAAEYKGNETSIEALTKKQTLLDRALLESKAKVEETRKQLDSWRAALERVRQEQGASSEEYKQAQKKVQEYEYALANAETAQIELENAIRDNNEALEDSRKALDETNDELEETGEETKTLGDQVQGLADKLGLKLPDGAKKALDGMNAMSAGSVAALGAIATGVAAAIKAVQKLSDITLEAAERADELVTRAAKTGLDVETLQQLDYAKRFLDFGDVDQMLQKLTVTMDKARDGAKAQADAFEQLGVSIYNQDGTLRNNMDTFKDVVRALQGVGDETERDALANDIFGKSFADLKPLIEAGGVDALQEFMDKAVEAGVVLDKNQIQKLAAVDDKYQELQATVEGFQNTLAVEFSDAVIAAMDTFMNAISKAGQVLVDTGLIENLGKVVRGIAAIIDAGLDFVNVIPSWMNPLTMLSKALEAIAYVAALVADTLNALSGLMPWNWGSGKFTTALGLNIGSGQMSNIQKLYYGNDYTYNGVGWDIAPSGSAGYDASKGLYYDRNGNYMYNASGNDNWRGGLTWVGEAGPELVSLPRGSQILNAQDSRNMGGGQVININVQGIQQLDEIVSWYESRRVRGRMA